MKLGINMTPLEATQALYLLNVDINITNMGALQNSVVEVTLDIIRHYYFLTIFLK